MDTQTEQIAKLIVETTALNKKFHEKEDEIDAKVDSGIGEFRDEVLAIQNGQNHVSYGVNSITFWEKINLLKYGSSMSLTLTEDVVWDRDVNKDNTTLIVNLNGHKLTLKEKNFKGMPFLYGMQSSNTTVCLSGNSMDGSELVLPTKTLDSTIGSHGSFLFSENHGWADANILALGYGLKVVDNGDFTLISTKAGSALSVSGVTLESATRTWQDLVFGLQVVNGVAKNFSTNISLV